MVNTWLIIGGIYGVGFILTYIVLYRHYISKMSRNDKRFVEYTKEMRLQSLFESIVWPIVWVHVAIELIVEHKLKK